MATKQVAGQAVNRIFVSDMIVGNGQEQEIEHSLGRKPKLVFAFAVNTSTFSNSERYQIIEGTHDAKVVRFTVYNGPGPFYRVVAFA